MKKNKKSTNYILIILICSIILIAVYFGILLLLQNHSVITKKNEFGDYVGGVLNPLFTLLSTFSIIFFNIYNCKK